MQYPSGAVAYGEKRNTCTLYRDRALDYNGVAVDSLRQEGGVTLMITFLDFLLAVTASVVGYYICLVITFATQKQASPAAPSWAVS